MDERQHHDLVDRVRTRIERRVGKALDDGGLRARDELAVCLVVFLGTGRAKRLLDRAHRIVTIRKLGQRCDQAVLERRAVG